MNFAVEVLIWKKKGLEVVSRHDSPSDYHPPTTLEPAVLTFDPALYNIAELPAMFAPLPPLVNTAGRLQDNSDGWEVRNHEAGVTVYIAGRPPTMTNVMALPLHPLAWTYRTWLGSIAPQVAWDILALAATALSRRTWRYRQKRPALTTTLMERTFVQLVSTLAQPSSGALAARHWGCTSITAILIARGNTGRPTSGRKPIYLYSKDACTYYIFGHEFDLLSRSLFSF
eukprot:scaffold273526_cov40-Attheya_sp.AAC.2